VLLAEGAVAEAVATLRDAASAFRELDLPYEAARTRVLVARARAAAGDAESAAMDLEDARRIFEQLGARPDLSKLDVLDARGAAAGTLTDRECEVLRLVAQGKTNREIGRTLVISEHTVARHVQNIFTKLGLSSRAAATAYAYQHDIM
jgi:DNA-binding NarL/FixJ family response regulator